MKWRGMEKCTGYGTPLSRVLEVFRRVPKRIATVSLFVCVRLSTLNSASPAELTCDKIPLAHSYIG